MFVLEEADTVIVLGDGACHKQGAAQEWGLIPGMIGNQKAMVSTREQNMEIGRLLLFILF